MDYMSRVFATPLAFGPTGGIPTRDLAVFGIFCINRFRSLYTRDVSKPSPRDCSRACARFPVSEPTVTQYPKASAGKPAELHKSTRRSNRELSGNLSAIIYQWLFINEQPPAAGSYEYRQAMRHGSQRRTPSERRS